ncbi:MAG: addiction module toxin, HicA family [Chloroflexi bacterium]|nr:addiction module toxin, HicA family [Chloroflexota bacterium]
MPKLPRIDGRTLVRVMERDGFEHVRTKGSHFILQKIFSDNQRVVIPVPVHAGQTLKVGTLSGILRKARISRDRLIALL